MNKENTINLNAARAAYGIEEGATLDLFLIAVSQNRDHGRYEYYRAKYPLYFESAKN